MTYTKLIILGLILCTLGIIGCSNTSTSSGFGSGGGYSINLTATTSILPQGGRATLIASVRDAQGNPVNDSSTTAVSFSSTWGASITTTSINLGICTATYTAPSPTAASVVDQITASYQGAYAYISINVYKP